jgi:hypothetical protein
MLIDIDITQSNSRLAITGYTANNKFQFGTHVYCDNASFSLPYELRNPLIRSIDEERVLVFGRTKQYDEAGQNNAWIFNINGEVICGFSTRGAVENIIVTKDFIVAAYFDEAACYGEGLEVYDFEGSLLFGYEELFGKEAVRIDDCYASALVKDNQIIFCPYMEFPVVVFDIENKSQEIWKMPEGIRGFSAITKLADRIYFHHTYTDKFGIYEWQIGAHELKRIGEYENYFVRGLPDGRFLAKTESGGTIITVCEIGEHI